MQDDKKIREKIREVFDIRGDSKTLYRYSDLISLLNSMLQKEDISLGENALGIKCFCRDDNQDLIGALLTGLGSSSGWFDLNAFGAYPAGRSIESLGPPSHHIPELRTDPWAVVVHATHVGCDSQFTIGKADRYGMRNPGSSCGLLAGILARHKERKAGNNVGDLKDFEMYETEKALLPYLDEIEAHPYPMAAAAEKTFEIGATLFDSLIEKSDMKVCYIGGVNIDNDAAAPGNNLFVLKEARIYDGKEKKELSLQ